MRLVDSAPSRRKLPKLRHHQNETDACSRREGHTPAYMSSRQTCYVLAAEQQRTCKQDCIVTAMVGKSEAGSCVIWRCSPFPRSSVTLEGKRAFSRSSNAMVSHGSGPALGRLVDVSIIKRLRLCKALHNLLKTFENSHEQPSA